MFSVGATNGRPPPLSFRAKSRNLVETNRSAYSSRLALSKVAGQIPLIGKMARRAKKVAAAAERGGRQRRKEDCCLIYTLAFPKVAGKVSRGYSRVTIEDCCLIFRKKLFNKEKSNYKTSILFSLNFASLNSASFPASWGSQGNIIK